MALDLMERGDSQYFQQYLNSRRIGERIKTYWGTEQTDVAKLRAIVEKEFKSPLDLVIDDASHMYQPTKVSFETLFPLLRPGGFYVVEDWAWTHWCQDPNFSLPNGSEPTKLIFEFIESAGTTAKLIAGMTIFQGLVIIERGNIDAAELDDFKLENYIARCSVNGASIKTGENGAAKSDISATQPSIQSGVKWWVKKFTPPILIDAVKSFRQSNKA